MQSYQSTLYNIPINELHLPGTWQSDQYFTSPTQTQTLSIYDQLLHGVRYLDLAFSYYENLGWRNSPQGHNASQIFAQIQQFLQEKDGEIVIVEISIQKGRESNEHLKTIIDAITENLGDFLYQGTEKLDFTYGDMVQKKKNVMLIVDDETVRKELNVFSSSVLKTKTYSTCDQNQLEVFFNRVKFNNKNKITKLVWALDNKKCQEHTNLELAQSINDKLIRIHHNKLTKTSTVLQVADIAHSAILGIQLQNNGIDLKLPNPDINFENSYFFYDTSIQEDSTDYALWMEENLDVLGTRTLKDLTLPGTHDSGSYKLTKDLAQCPWSVDSNWWIETAETVGVPVYDVITPWAMSQDKSVYDQLMAGARYIDLRTGWDNQKQVWRTFHMEMGTQVVDILDQIATFLIIHEKEVIVIETSHFCGSPTLDELKDLIGIVIDEIGDWLFPAQTNLHFTLNDMISQDKRVIVTVENDDITQIYPQIWSDKVIINSYASSCEISDLQNYNDDLWRNTDFTSYANQLYKMTWTLTPDATCIIEGILEPWNTKDSLLNLGGYANQYLKKFWEGHRNQRMGNILIFDDFPASGVMEIIMDMNGISTSTDGQFFLQ